MSTSLSARRVLGMLVCTLALPSCSFLAPNGRFLASQSSPPDLISIFESIKSDVMRGAQSSLECREGLSSHYQRLLAIHGKEVRAESYSDQDLESLIANSFETRLAIMEKLSALKVKTKDDRACLNRVQDTVRALRYAEDYLAELLIEREGAKQLEQKYHTLIGREPYLLVNPKFNFKGPEDLAAGDIILSRGNAYSSAAIARIGSNDTQFSHLSFVYEDEKGELHTSEAHIEIGNVVAPLKVHLEQGNARTVVFRYKDKAVAERASKIIYQKIQKAQKSGKNIQYDFAMDLKDNQKLFCSEVIYDGFKQASGGKLDIPRFKTNFTVGMLPFLQTLGIAVNEANINQFETFAPGDIQFDSDFSLVAEWRDPSKLQDNRQKDAVLTMIFKWMEDENYQFNPAISMGLKAQVAWLGRRLPIVRQKLEEEFPLNMSTDQLKLFFVLDEVAAPMQDHLKALHEKKRTALTPIEMYKALEELRITDRKNYLSWSRYKRELQELERERDNADSWRKWELRKLIKKHTPIFHERFKPKKLK